MTKHIVKNNARLQNSFIGYRFMYMLFHFNLHSCKICPCFPNLGHQKMVLILFIITQEQYKHISCSGTIFPISNCL